MEPKKTHTTFRKDNLLNQLEFILQLKFEVAYANSIRGGHVPLYISPRLKKRLVASHTLLSGQELQGLVLKFYTLPN